GLHRAAADRIAVEPSDDEAAGGRRHLRIRGGPVLRRVVSALEPLGELPEIGFEALPSGVARRGFEIDRHASRAEQPLDFAHRADQALAPARVERLQHRRRERVRKPVVGLKLPAPLLRELDLAKPAVARILARLEKPLARQGLHHPAHVAGIEAEPHAQRAQVRSFGSDLEDEARLAERPAALEIARLQRADAQRDRSVEAANLPNLIAIHSLTLVRVLCVARGTRGAAVPFPSHRPMARLHSKKWVRVRADGRCSRSPPYVMTLGAFRPVRSSIPASECDSAMRSASAAWVSWPRSPDGGS